MNIGEYFVLYKLICKWYKLKVIPVLVIIIAETHYGRKLITFAVPLHLIDVLLITVQRADDYLLGILRYFLSNRSSVVKVQHMFHIKHHKPTWVTRFGASVCSFHMGTKAKDFHIVSQLLQSFN